MKNKYIFFITFFSFFFCLNAPGQCWEKVYEHPNALGKLETYDMHFLNDSTGWVITAHLGGNEPLVKTIDGGETWVPNNNLPFASGTYVTVYFVTEQIGWVGGSEIIYQTTNGGETWVESEIENADIASTTFLDIKFFNPELGWAVGGGTSFGNNGMKIFHSNNGGMYWALQLNTGENQVAWEIDFISELEVWVAASSDFNVGILLHTEDGGENWEEELNLQNGSFQDVFFLNDTLGWVSGKNNTLLKTTDGGESWVPLPVPVTEHLFQGFSVHFIDEHLGWIGGTYGQGVHVTTDGGQTWNKQVDLIGVNSEIQMTSPDRGYAIDSYGYVYRYQGAEAQCNAILEHPTPETSNASLYPLLSWLPASGCFDGYNLMLGLSPGGAEVLPLTDMGKDTSFQITTPLPDATTIYVTIQPYNYVYGPAEACQSYSFTTVACPAMPTITDASLCPGDSLLWQDSLITAAGAYTFDYQTALGCDSTEILEVEILKTYFLQLDTAFCLGDDFFWGDSLLTEPGVYTFDFLTEAGCDSTVEVHLGQLLHSTIFIDTFVLVNEPYQGIFYMQDTILVDLFEAANGCDSVVTTHLHVVTNTGNINPSAWYIYPNPTVDDLWIEGPETPQMVLIYDASGRLVRRVLSSELVRTAGNEFRFKFSLEAMPTGLFLLAIQTKEALIWEKVIVK